jgi:hypothetical protein
MQAARPETKSFGNSFVHTEISYGTSVVTSFRRQSIFSNSFPHFRGCYCDPLDDETFSPD